MSDSVRSEKTQALLTLSKEMVSEQQAEQTIDGLIDVLRYHNELYYVYAQPIISDSQYDHLFSLLVDLEKDYPLHIRPDSPTQRLAINLQAGFSKAKHGGYQILSLQNTYNAEQVRDWYNFLVKQADDGTTYAFVVEPKFDGSSVHLIYKYGHFVQAISRGDGSVGEDITENIKVVRNLPLLIPQAKDIPLLRFRAEVLMPKQALIQLNQYQQEEGLPLFANTRNATAGTLRQLDPYIVAQRNLTIFVHQLLTRQEVGCATHQETFTKLRERGLPYYRYKHFTTIDEVISYCIDESTYKDLLKANIEFDGLVIKVDNLSQREKIGTTAHHPRRAIAYKFPAQQVATKLLSITYQVGRTGVITPVASFDPVQLSGATISKATLHNFDFIQGNDIRIGDYVWIQRSGEVIPYVVGPIIERRVGDELPFVMPTHCPSCGGGLSKTEGEVAWYCTNELCDAQIKERLKHFVARGSMNIVGLGESIIEQLVDAKLVHTYVDLYALHLPQNRLQLHSLPGLAEKKIDQILTQIEASKKNPARRLLHGLGVPFVGKKIATMLERYLADQGVTTYEQVIESITNQESLSNIYGLGPQTINALHDFFSDELNQQTLKSLVEKGVNILPAGGILSDTTQGEFVGVTCVITGTFPVAREEISKILEQAGAKVTNSVTSKTTWLLAGEKAGSKYEKAQSLGIPVYGWEEILKVLPKLATLQPQHDGKKRDKNDFLRAQSLFG